MATRGKVNPKDLKAEIVIIGGGGAGLSAAITAVEAGARASNIIVIEKRRSLGGNTAFSGGMFGADSPTQRRLSIQFHRDDLFKFAMNWAYWKSNPKIVRAFINKSGDTIRWLEDKGMHFELMSLFPNQIPLVWHTATGPGPKWGGGKTMAVLEAECKKLEIPVLTRTAAKKILMSGGKAVGVIASTGKDSFTIKADAVIIASGGFVGNKQLLKKYCPYYFDGLKSDGGLPLKGDGLKMALEVGADTEGLGQMLFNGPHVYNSSPMKVGYPPHERPLGLASMASEPVLWVNKNGERFADETVGFNRFVCVNAIARQPDRISFSIYDSAMIKKMEANGFVIIFREAMPGLERELQAQAEKGFVKMSDTWDGIADWIGSDRAVLKSTVDEYNGACDHGYDPLFAKDRLFLVPLKTPPYYAVRCNVGFLDTIGGIKINENMEVLDKKGNPIPGLYAAGVVAGGWEGDTYCAVISGAASGFAINSGRIAGENAKKSIHGNK
jgi:fumarate reductase flavoprotein subunit